MNENRLIKTDAVTTYALGILAFLAAVPTHSPALLEISLILGSYATTATVKEALPLSRTHRLIIGLATIAGGIYTAVSNPDSPYLVSIGRMMVAGGASFIVSSALTEKTLAQK